MEANGNQGLNQEFSGISGDFYFLSHRNDICWAIYPENYGLILCFTSILNIQIALKYHIFVMGAAI